MPRGGVRPGSGRKTNAERDQQRLREQAAEASVVPASDEKDEAYWGAVYEKAMGGNVHAQKLWAEYRFGRPTQRQQEMQDPVFNLWCSFRGQPYVCLECQKKSAPDGVV